MQSKKKFSGWKIFLVGFFAVTGLMIFSTLRSKRDLSLLVPQNKGMAHMNTVNNSLMAVFQGGQVCVWDWRDLSKKHDFSMGTDRAVLLDENRLVAVSSTGRKILTVYDIAAEQKISDMTAGRPDQDVFPRISRNKDVLILVRKNQAAVDSQQIDYEFLTADLKEELLGIPVRIPVQYETEDFVDYAVSDSRVAYAAGSREKAGRLLAIDLNTGKTLWDRDYPDTLEFCSVLPVSDEGILFAGNRNGFLYKLDTEQGEILKQIRLLEEGETRPITNDLSVLNLAVSSNGDYYVATINPKVYILQMNSDDIVHTCSPADRLISKIAFSPDGQSFATSDIRAGYPIKIWPMPEEK